VTFIDKDIDIICGSYKINYSPFEVASKLTVEFLNQISIKVLKEKKYKKFPDLVSFAFWCRRSNIIKIKESLKENRFGRGVVLHICPSNVAMNYAYSLVFGLISGNTNIVRLPSIKFSQVNILNEIIKKQLKINKFKILNKRIILINYKRSDNISNKLSMISDARLIWGGDQTISAFKKYNTKPRVLDLYFANRYSLCLINSKKFNKLKNIQIKEIVNKFFIDCYTMSQNACSSPKSLIWSGNINLKKKELFWNELKNKASNKFDFDITISNKKILNLNRIILNKNITGQVEFDKFHLVRVKYRKNQIPENLESLQANLGTFFEFEISSNSILKKFISSKTQSLTYFGYNKFELLDLIKKNNLQGIDRMIKIGNAFEMSHIWDGINIIENLSREIEII
jgi:hypothetical protein